MKEKELFEKYPDLKVWYDVYIKPNEITFKSPDDMLSAYKKCLKYDFPYLDSLDEIFFQVSGGRWDRDNEDAMIYSRKDLERINKIYRITLDHCTPDCQYDECDIETELDVEFERYVYDTTPKEHPAHQAFLKNWKIIRPTRLEWEKEHPRWVSTFKRLRRKRN